MTRTLLLLPGDGIEPEVMAISRRIVHYLVETGAVDLAVSEADFGGTSYDRHGAPIADAALATALASDSHG